MRPINVFPTVYYIFGFSTINKLLMSFDINFAQAVLMKVSVTKKYSLNL